MKKRVLVILLFLLVMSIFLVTAQTNETSDDVSTKAYSCLEDKVEDECSSLSTEEKIFSLLAIGECKTELISDSDNDECWPDSGCKIKTTAQAILALRNSNTNTQEAEDWLLDQTMAFPDIEWFLQVESNNEVSCTATYGGSSYTFSINEDKTLSGNVGSCLSLYQSYWLQVSSSCYDEEFKISCSNSFLTSLLYRKKNSPTFYVLEDTHSASGEGTTTEKVSSSCFKEGSSCDYEGTLWASIVLKSREYNVSSYIPYLVVNAEDNSEYIPESFLYTLTNNFRVDLLANQQESKWWSESGDKFYDTSVALLPFQNEELTEKTNSKNWLEEIQGDNGCWQDNIRNTAFILYSLWPKKISTEDVDEDDCESSNFYCMSSASCLDAGGNVLSSYSGCFGTNICCDKPQQIQSCSEQGGEVCDSDEECLGGSFVSSSDSDYCCVNGECGVQETPECELQGGTCRTSCLSNEKTSSYACTTSSDICCMPKKTSYVGIIIFLIILIILAVLGIVFKKKVREFLLKLKSKFEKGKGKAAPSRPGPRFPPTPSARIPPRAVQRRVIPTSQAPKPQLKRPPVKSKSEFDEVLKKLKEIGK